MNDVDSMRILDQIEFQLSGIEKPKPIVKSAIKNAVFSHLFHIKSLSGVE